MGKNAPMASSFIYTYITERAAPSRGRGGVDNMTVKQKAVRGKQLKKMGRVGKSSYGV